MLHVISVAEATQLARTVAKTVDRTETAAAEALPGRVTAEDIVCPEDVPAFCRSTMDGYALRAADTFGAGEACPADLWVIGETVMGEAARRTVTAGTCVKIPTGGMLPAGADAVIPVEYTDLDFDVCLVYRAISPWENVTRVGDDVKKGACLFKKGTRLTPASVGVLAAAGIAECRVFCKPRVGILSTGNELVSVRQPSPIGKVRDVNTHLLSALCESCGCTPRAYGIFPDEEASLSAALLRAAEDNDIVLLSGGSSAGEKDLTAKLIGTLGEVCAHGLAMKPGKPTVIGKIGGTPVFGLPGHPTAAYFVCETVVKPCLETLSGAPLPVKQTAAVLSENVSSNHGREELLCVRLQNGAAKPVYGKSGVVSQLSAADGYLRIPRDCEGLPAGTEVTVFLF